MARRNKQSQHPVTASPTLTLQESADKIIEQGNGEVTEQPVEEAAPEAPSARQTITARCQEAKEMGACACRCRGKYHGKAHPDGWKDEEGCEPLTPGERKLAKKDTLNAWRRAHPDRVKTYMANWNATSDAPTAMAARISAAKRAEKQKLTPLASEQASEQQPVETVAQ